MQRPKVINLNTEQKPAENYTYVGRPSVWGNPFRIGRDGDREEVLEKYRHWIIKRPEVLRRLRSLAGKTIGCFCKPKACHADVLADLVEALPDRE